MRQARTIWAVPSSLQNTRLGLSSYASTVLEISKYLPRQPRPGQVLIRLLDSTQTYASQTPFLTHGDLPTGWQNSSIVNFFSALSKGDPENQMVYYQVGFRRSLTVFGALTRR